MFSNILKPNTHSDAWSLNYRKLASIWCGLGWAYWNYNNRIVFHSMYWRTLRLVGDHHYLLNIGRQSWTMGSALYDKNRKEGASSPYQKLNWFISIKFGLKNVSKLIFARNGHHRFDNPLIGYLDVFGRNGHFFKGWNPQTSTCDTFLPFYKLTRYDKTERVRALAPYNGLHETLHLPRWLRGFSTDNPLDSSLEMQYEHYNSNIFPVT